MTKGANIYNTLLYNAKDACLTARLTADLLREEECREPEEPRFVGYWREAASCERGDLDAREI